MMVTMSEKTETLPPNWAIERAIKESNSAWTLGDVKIASEGPYISPHCCALVAFARLIAKHETQPVDPLLLRAREIWASEYKVFRNGDTYFSSQILEGTEDTAFAMKILLRALREGIELGKGETQ